MLPITDALATASGEIIYQDNVCTTYGLSAKDMPVDSTAKNNMLVWSQFMAGQYHPETVDQSADQCLHKNYTWHGDQAPHGLTGEVLRNSARTQAKVIHHGVTGFHITNRMFGYENRLVNFWCIDGVHSKELLGVPPSGKAFQLHGIAIGLFKDNKQIEEWEYYENLAETLRGIAETDNNDKQEKTLDQCIAMWGKTVEEKINEGNFASLESTYSEDYIYHGPSGDEDFDVLAKMKKAIQELRKGFSDIHITNDIFGDGDRAVNHFVLEGTHDGVWQGVYPTKKRVKVTGVSIGRFEKGQVVEEWEFFDEKGILSEIK